ncbi:MAG: hypothetical protein M1840_008402 [Geoglossum simile]|nr:MAG: hypothetical protein M1840_008402 [Geoglossum simile]
MLFPQYTNFSITKCLADVRLKYNETTHPTLFMERDGFNCGAQETCLTLAGCWELCGGDVRGRYDMAEVFAVVATWVFPLFLLAANINYMSIGNTWYFTYFAVLVHFLADPIDAIWSLSLKIDVGRRAYQFYCDKEVPDSNAPVRAREFAVVALALDDHGFECSYGPECNYEELLERVKNATDVEKEAFVEAAKQLTDSRGSGGFRAGAAVFFYIFGVIVAYTKLRKSPDMPAHTPHIIALRVLYFWLIPAVILSAIAGKFPSEYTSYYILNSLDQKLSIPWNRTHLEPWTGGTYCWRPVKKCRQGEQWRTVGYLIISLLCVGSAFGISFFISWKTPSEGMGCRSVAELFYMVVWVTNFLSTCFVGSEGCRRSYRFWSVVVVKDTLLALPMIAVLLGAFAGKFIIPFSHLSSYRTHPLTSKNLTRLVELLLVLVSAI